MRKGQPHSVRKQSIFTSVTSSRSISALQLKIDPMLQKHNIDHQCWFKFKLKKLNNFTQMYITLSFAVK